MSDFVCSSAQELRGMKFYTGHHPPSAWDSIYSPVPGVRCPFLIYLCQGTCDGGGVLNFNSIAWICKKSIRKSHISSTLRAALSLADMTSGHYVARVFSIRFCPCIFCSVYCNKKEWFLQLKLRKGGRACTDMDLNNLDLNDSIFFGSDDIFSIIRLGLKNIHIMHSKHRDTQQWEVLACCIVKHRGTQQWLC